MKNDSILTALLVTLIAAWLTLGYAVYSYGSSYPATTPQPDHPQMLQAGSRLEADVSMQPVGMLVATCILLVFGLCIRLGIGDAFSSSIRWLVIGLTVAFTLTFAAMIFAIGPYSENPRVAYLFPQPTFIMLFGVWVVPVGFILIYSIGFSKWIYPESDRKRYQAVLAKHATDPDSHKGDR